MGWAVRKSQEYILLSLGCNAVEMLRGDTKFGIGMSEPPGWNTPSNLVKTSAQDWSSRTNLSFQHDMEINCDNTAMWEQQPDGNFLQRVGNVFLGNGFSIVEDVQVNADAMLVATRTSRNRDAIWIFQPPANYPRYGIWFLYPVIQMLFHPVFPNYLVIITAQPQPSFYIWHNMASMPATVPLALPRGQEETGDIIGAWLGAIAPARYPLLVCSPTAFDIGTLMMKDRRFIFVSILPEAEKPTPKNRKNEIERPLDQVVKRKAEDSLQLPQTAPTSSVPEAGQLPPENGENGTGHTPEKGVKRKVDSPLQHPRVQKLQKTRH